MAGVSNGNAVLNVGGTFSQNTGDTRIIYNISTTNSGVFNATFGNLILNGGIFMGQTACHTSGGISSMIVNNNFNLSFANVTDKFRGTSLTSIGSSVNNVKFNLTIGGDLSVTGNSTAEFTSTASSGNETISINGNVLINGMSNSFNYGTPSAAHDMVLTIGGDLIISGGSTFLSHNSGNTSVNITGNTTMQAGTFSLKGDSGNALLLFNGNFLQNGGIFYLHNNPAIATSNPLSMTVNGDFIQSSGTINFDNNQSVQSATHSINIAGSNYTLSGNGLITHASAGTGTIFGRINYLTNGTINYILTSPNHLLEQIKQTVRNGTTVSIISGNIQVASSVIPATDFFEIYPGGTVNANNGQFYSIGSGIHSCIKVDSGGILKTARTSGLYNNTSGACINASGQLDYYLDPSSIIEYNGINNQVITGVPASVPNTDNHKYGILRVNFQGTDDIEYTSLTQNVYIRTKLELAHGELNLHGNKLTIESGNPSAITRNIGYIKSETNTSANTSILSWKYLAAGHYIFPFGTNSSSYIPVEFEPVSGFGGEVSISTRATTGTDNQPVPAVSNTEKPIKLIVGGEDISRTGILDRWWNIKADGYTANVTVHYRGIENTLKDNNCCGIMNIISLNDNTWSLLSGNGAGTTASTGNITATNVTQFSNWMIASNSTPLPFKVNDFEVNPEGTQVHIVWKHSFEPTNNYFNVERSDDGNNFESIEQIKGNANADLSPDYSALDKSPFEGTSYYRLRATNYDGRIMYSDIKTINFQTGINDQLKIKDFGPNPFENNLRVTYEVNQPGPVEFQLTSSQGQIISAEKIMAVKGINRYDFINKGKLTTGIYLLNITFNNKTIVKKLMRK